MFSDEVLHPSGTPDVIPNTLLSTTIGIYVMPEDKQVAAHK